MAHEALLSLNLIIESFLNSPILYDPFLFDVHEVVWSLKSILELDHFEKSERLNAFKAEILEAVPKLRGVLEDKLNKSQLPSSESQSLDEAWEKCPLPVSKNESLGGRSSNGVVFYQNLNKFRKEMISFNNTMKKIIKEYNAKLDLETSNKDSPLVDEDFGGSAKDTVGVYDEDLRQLIDKLMKKPYIFKIISVVGMAGIGKTTIVKALYNDPSILDYFDTRAFIRVGPDYNLRDMLLDLLVCLSPNYNKVLGIGKSEDELGEQVYEFVKGRRYLIVFDDAWDSHFYRDMRRCLPDDHNGSSIVFTTRQSGLFDFSGFAYVHEIRLRNEEESWNIFCGKVFVPPGLEKLGKKIVKKCGGLPLGIISIANILSKAEKTLDYWEKVAKNENFLALATEEGSHMSESLFLSYKHLPQHLKECCLYIGVFPLNHEISVSKLVKLWVGEGLVQPRRFQIFEDNAREYLEDLVSHNVVLVRQQSSSRRTKTCSAHYFFWHLLVREAANKKIFHLINSYPSAFSEDIHCQRKLCIHRNALLGLKRVSESIQSVSNVRSFLCTGPEHQYPVSICSGLTSLKVLDALTIRLYKFPIGILDLVELKYLAFTYDGKLPSAISRLKNLVCLIVHRYYLTIINSSPSYMPTEIWNMQELRHLQVVGSDMPHPVDGAQLPNLLTLLGVSDRSCTKEVFQSIPNLKKLGVQIVLPQGVSETLHIFDHLALLSRLESFKCIVSNPNPGSQQVLLLPESVFPSSLRKLTLSGCGFACEDMPIIGRALYSLRALKLRCYAIQGLEWKSGLVSIQGPESKSWLFSHLEYLLLEDIDLVHLDVGYGFPLLNRLIIRHCYKLEEISYKHKSNSRGNLKLIELVDCSPSALKSAKQILEEKRKLGNNVLRLQVYSSTEKGYCFY